MRQFADFSSRSTAHTLDARIQRDDEFSDSEDEGTGGRRDRTSHASASASAASSRPMSKKPSSTSASSSSPSVANAAAAATAVAPAAPSGTGVSGAGDGTSELIPPATRPPASTKEIETVAGQPEGEDVPVTAAETLVVEESADRATFERERNGNGTEDDVEMKDA